MATMVQAVRLALHYGEEHLGVTDVFGEDVGPPLGGVFTATQGLKTAWNSPLDERGIIGAAMGIAYAGGRPVCEIQFCDYGFNTIDLLKVAGNQRWAGAGEWDLPLVMMTPSGSGIRGSLYHSHSFESWASRLAGWKIVMPSNPLDAYGLMLSAIKDPNPVMVLLPKALLRMRGDKLIPGEPEDPDFLKQMIDAPVGDRSRWQPTWPNVKEHLVPIGVAATVREGNDATVISYGRTLPMCVQEADRIREETGFAYEVIDLRSIFPYDWKAISCSVLKTGRVLIVNEDTEVTNFGEHLLRRIVEEHFYDLLVRPRVLFGKHVPGIGLNQVYEQNTVPQLPCIKAAMEELAHEVAREAQGRGPIMEFKLPELGEGVYEAEAVRWLVKQGEAVKPGQTLLEVLTDKATMEVPAPFAGIVQKLLIESGQKIEIGQAILEYEDKKGGNAKPTPKAETKQKTVTPVHAPSPVRDNGAATTTASVKAAPSVRLMARKLGIDLGQIHGSGPAGRIVIDDLAPHVNARAKPAAAPPTDYGKPGTRVKFAGLRRKIAEHMVHSKHTIPHYTYVDDCDVTDLVKLRESLKEPFAQKGAKLTYLAFFVKAVVAALKEVPIANASLDEEAGEIVLHDHYHIGIAVATHGGLILPVVRDADKKSLLDVAKEIDRLSNDARHGKSQLDDLRGGTFSVTSIGNIGGLFATPIIPHPQVGILGVGKIVKRPIYDEHGQIRSADMVYLSFSFDHRVLDGAVGAALGNAVIKQLQNPAALLL